MNTFPVTNIGDLMTLLVRLDVKFSTKTNSKGQFITIDYVRNGKKFAVDAYAHSGRIIHATY